MSLDISVVTINHNNRNGLADTIRSIEQQSFTPRDFIVVDAGSTDGSLDLIDEKLKQGVLTHPIVGQDSGIYNAMNIGSRHASGSHILFLNSGDTLASPEVFETIVLRSPPEGSVIFARARLVSPSNKSYLYPKRKAIIKKWIKYNVPNHQAMLFPKCFFCENQFDEKYEVSSDYDYKLRALNQCNSYFVDIVFSNFSLGGISSDCSDIKTIVRQSREVFSISLKNHEKIKGFFVGTIKSAKFPTKYLLRKFLGAGYWTFLAQLRRNI